MIKECKYCDLRFFFDCANCPKCGKTTTYLSPFASVENKIRGDNSQQKNLGNTIILNFQEIKSDSS